SSRGFEFKGKKPEWVEKSVLVLPREPGDGEEGNTWFRQQVFNNEATMDALSDEVLHDYIRERPEFVVWMHNALAGLKEALVIVRSRLEEAYVQNNQAVIPPSKEVFQQMESELGFIERGYFAAFANSDEALAF